MSDDKEVGPVSKQSSDSDIGVVSVASIGMSVVLRNCCQVCWGSLEEVGFKLCFAVLFTRD